MFTFNKETLINVGIGFAAGAVSTLVTQAIVRRLRAPAKTKPAVNTGPTSTAQKNAKLRAPLILQAFGERRDKTRNATIQSSEHFSEYIKTLKEGDSFTFSDPECPSVEVIVVQKDGAAYEFYSKSDHVSHRRLGEDSDALSTKKVLTDADVDHFNSFFTA